MTGRGIFNQSTRPRPILPLRWITHKLWPKNPYVPRVCALSTISPKGASQKKRGPKKNRGAIFRQRDVNCPTIKHSDLPNEKSKKISSNPCDFHRPNVIIHL